MLADYVVIDWGLGGHEIPFIIGTVKALAVSSTRILVAVPSTWEGSQHFKQLVRKLDHFKGVEVRTFRFDISAIRPRRYQGVVNIFRTISNIRRQLGGRPKYGYIFTTVNGQWHPHIATSMLLHNLNWSGHLLHPHMDVDRLTMDSFRQLGFLPSCRGLGITHDSINVCENLPNVLQKKIFIHPELVDLNVPDHIVRSVVPIVTMIGSINRYKDIDNFIAMASVNRNFLFRVVGKFVDHQFTDMERNNIYQAFSELGINHTDEFIADGVDFNRFILESTFVWSAYSGFQHSSNVQQKANAFNIPCLIPAAGLLNSRRKSNDYVASSTEKLHMPDKSSFGESLDHARTIEHNQVSVLREVYDRMFRNTMT